MPTPPQAVVFPAAVCTQDSQGDSRDSLNIVDRHASLQAGRAGRASGLVRASPAPSVMRHGKCAHCALSRGEHCGGTYIILRLTAPRPAEQDSCRTASASSARHFEMATDILLLLLQGLLKVKRFTSVHQRIYGDSRKYRLYFA